MLTSVATQSANIIKYLTEHGYKGGLLLSDGAKAGDLFEIATALPTWLQQPGNVLLGTEIDGLSGKNSASFIQMIADSYGEEPDTFSSTAYDCTFAIVMALLHGGGTNSQEHRAAVKAHMRGLRASALTTLEVGIGAAGMQQAKQAIANDEVFAFQGPRGSWSLTTNVTAPSWECEPAVRTTRPRDGRRSVATMLS